MIGLELLESIIPEILGRLAVDLRADPLMTSFFVCSTADVPRVPFERDHYYCFEDFDELAEQVEVLEKKNHIRNRTLIGVPIRKYDILPGLLRYLDKRTCVDHNGWIH